MNKRIVIDPLISPKPEQINTTEHFWDAFGHSETEISARHIVRLMQKRGTGWAPFTFGEINDLYQTIVEISIDYTFNRLTREGWVVQEGDLYRVTYDFVYRCHLSSPKD